MLARFLYSIPPSLVGQRKYQTKPVNPFVREQYEKLVYELLDIPDMFGERLIKLSPEAAILSEQYNQWIEYRLTNEFEEIEDWAGKLHGNTMRVAGVFHLIKYRLNAYNMPLEAETMAAAIQVGKYYQFTIPEIQVVEVQWLAELELIGIPEEARMFCSEMCRLVIEKKLEKQAEV